jgi:hypothetical protein
MAVDKKGIGGYGRLYKKEKLPYGSFSRTLGTTLNAGPFSSNMDLK